jgi:zinc finger SWIM domain-containing protein 3
VCVKDEWKCLLLLYIIISLLCLSKCKTNVVTKLIFENSCHTLVRWWCKGIYKILTIGKKNKKKIFQQDNYVQLYRHSSRKLGTGSKYKNMEVADLLIYMELDYSCIHGGTNFSSISSGQRPNTR